jgi:hypothetical protein
MKLFLTTTCAALLTLSVAFAQQPAPVAAHDNTEVSGCLMKADGKFVIASTSGERLDVMAPGGLLDAHANHEVKLTGSKMTKEGKSSFSATKVEMVASTCTTKS